MSITIRAVGQAAKRGATRRVPNAVALLAIVDEWMAEGATDTMRHHAVGERTADGAIEASFHPAARPIRFEATETGRLIVEAMTVPVGPGYHTYVASLLHRMGDELEIEWAPAEGADPGEVEDDGRSGGSAAVAAASASAAALQGAGRAVLSKATSLEDDGPLTIGRADRRGGA